MATILNEYTKAFDELPDSAAVPVRTAAQILGVSECTVWRWAREGRIRAIKVGQRSTRFPVSDIRQLLAIA